MLAPARRACGLASNDAEEALDRVMQEPHFRSRGAGSKLAEQALTVTTYLRRLTQSVTTLAPLVPDTRRLDLLAARLEGLARGEVTSGAATGVPADGGGRADAAHRAADGRAGADAGRAWRVRTRGGKGS